MIADRPECDPYHFGTGVGIVPGSYTATITVKDAAGNKITQNVKITVETAAFANGTFYGTAKPGKSSDPSAYLQFSVRQDGQGDGQGQARIEVALTSVGTVPCAHGQVPAHAFANFPSCHWGLYNHGGNCYNADV